MNQNEPDRPRARAGAVMLGAALALACLGPARATDLAPPELTGAPGQGQHAAIVQAGHFNQALIEQRHGASQFAELVQDGFNNQLQALQSGHHNFLDARQSGADNVASITQSGALNRVDLAQLGFDNRANVEQIGHGHHALVEQFGNSNRADIVQGISAPNVVVRQYGDHIVTTLIQY